MPIVASASAPSGTAIRSLSCRSSERTAAASMRPGRPAPVPTPACAGADSHEHDNGDADGPPRAGPSRDCRFTPQGAHEPVDVAVPRLVVERDRLPLDLRSLVGRIARVRVQMDPRYSCTGVPLTLSAMCSPSLEVSTRMATSSAAIGRFCSYCSACVQNAQRGGDHRADDDRSHAKRAVSLAHTIRHTRPHAHGSDCSRRCALQRTCRSRASAARRVVRSDPEPHPLESTEGDRIRSRAVTRSVPATALALLTATCAAHRSLVSMPCGESPHRVSTNPSASTSPPSPLRADVP